MLRKLLKFIIGLTILYLLIINFLPPIIDKKMNKSTQQAPYTASVTAQKLFDSLDFVADLHCDALLWKRNLNKKHSYGHVDIPRLIEGNVVLQAFTIVSKVPFGINFKSNASASDMLKIHTPAVGRMPSAWFNVTNRALAQCMELKNFAEKSEGKFRILYSSEDMQAYLKDRAQHKKITAGFLGLEGLHPLNNQLENVDVLYEAGVRMMAPVHFQDNEMGGSAHGEQKGGLSDFGKKVIDKIAGKKIILDVAHSSPEMLDDIFALYKKPIITSHTGVKGTCDSERNLSDEHLRAIAASGGLIGIALFEGAVCGKDAAATAKAMKYTVDLVGAEHVALGSDYDGSVTAPFDITGLVLLVDAMLKEGLSPDQIKLIMGENVRKFWLTNL